MDFEEKLKDLIGEARASGLVPTDEIIYALVVELDQLEDIQRQEDEGRFTTITPNRRWHTT